MSEEPTPHTYPSGVPRPDSSEIGVGRRVLVVSGMSGAGRTTAAAALADLGWYVVDNLPPHLLVELVMSISSGEHLAVVVDARGGAYFDDLLEVVDDLEARAVVVRLVFLDASDSVLVARFEGARRPHPLQGQGTLTDGIRAERARVSAVKERADEVIDTSTLNVHELRSRMAAAVGEREGDLTVNVLSFGFKHGTPPDADYVADMRFLDNPHWVEELRPLTGLDAPVRDYVLSRDGAHDYLDSLIVGLDIALTRYRTQDKHSVTVAVGCTGGKHRSVAAAEYVGEHLRERGFAVRVHHRELGS